MNFKLAINPLPFPATFNDPSTLKLVLGLGLFLAGALVFSLWKEKLDKTKEDERFKFLMFNLFGGAWLVAVFFACGGIYFLFDSILKFHA